MISNKHISLFVSVFILFLSLNGFAVNSDDSLRYKTKGFTIDASFAPKQLLYSQIFYGNNATLSYNDVFSCNANIPLARAIYKKREWNFSFGIGLNLTSVLFSCYPSGGYSYKMSGVYNTGGEFKKNMYYYSVPVFFNYTRFKGNFYVSTRIGVYFSFANQHSQYIKYNEVKWNNVLMHDPNLITPQNTNGAYLQYSSTTTEKSERIDFSDGLNPFYSLSLGWSIKRITLFISSEIIYLTNNIYSKGHWEIPNQLKNRNYFGILYSF